MNEMGLIEIAVREGGIKQIGFIAQQQIADRVLKTGQTMKGFGRHALRLLEDTLKLTGTDGGIPGKPMNGIRRGMSVIDLLGGVINPAITAMISFQPFDELLFHDRNSRGRVGGKINPLRPAASFRTPEIFRGE